MIQEASFYVQLEGYKFKNRRFSKEKVISTYSFKMTNNPVWSFCSKRERYLNLRPTAAWNKIIKSWISSRHLKLLSFLFRFFLFSRRNTGSISSGCLSTRKGGRCEASWGPDETGEGGGIYEELTSRLPACIVVKTNNSSDGYGLRGNSPS